MGICNERASNLQIDHYKTFLSTDQYQQIPLVSLEQAVKSLISVLPAIETYVQMVKQKCLQPIDGLTIDESASIMLYSIIWQPLNECLYISLNSTLQRLDKSQLPAWFAYLKLLFTALLRLPSNQVTVYRGSKMDLSTQYQLNEIILWWDLTLCTTSIDCLDEKEMKMIFTIKCQTMKNIQKHCYFPSENLVLFLPGTKFQVMGYFYDSKKEIYYITLEEIEPSFLLHSINDDQSIFSR